MRRSCLTALLSLIAACSSSAERRGNIALGEDGAVLPVVDTVDGVVVMRHSAEAFERAPVWGLDSVPQVVIDGGEEFDLTYVARPLPLSNGRFAVLRTIGGAQLMLFGRDGRPDHLLAGTGQGPGELIRGSEPVDVGGDTVVVVDGANATANWYHPDVGLVRTARTINPGSGDCFRAGGRLLNGRLVAVGNCSSNRLGADRKLRDDTPLLVFTPDYAIADTVAMVPGYRMAMMEIRQGSRTFEVPMPLRFGHFTTVTAIDSTIVVASGVGGYVLDLRSHDGTPVGRIVVDRRPVPVTSEMKQVVIDRELAELKGRRGGEASALTDEESRREIIEAPTADTLPPYGRALPGHGDVFWVLDYAGPGAPRWAATAFRRDGTIVGRIGGPSRGGGPVWFGRDQVMIREVDEDGVVRFAVYRVVKSDQ